MAALSRVSAPATFTEKREIKKEEGPIIITLENETENEIICHTCHQNNKLQHFTKHDNYCIMWESQGPAK